MAWQQLTAALVETVLSVALLGYLVVPDPYQLAGLRRGTTASL
jgi:antibiotic biosynthesis monooxygenase (ABM) superfamily enzyme